jgi:hypothetical protein
MPWLPQEGGSRTSEPSRPSTASEPMVATYSLQAVNLYFVYLRIHVYIGTLLCVSEGGAASHLHGIGGTRVVCLSDKKDKRADEEDRSGHPLTIPSTSELRFCAYW